MEILEPLLWIIMCVAFAAYGIKEWQLGEVTEWFKVAVC